MVLDGQQCVRKSVGCVVSTRGTYCHLIVVVGNCLCRLLRGYIMVIESTIKGDTPQHRTRWQWSEAFDSNSHHSRLSRSLSMVSRSGGGNAGFVTHMHVHTCATGVHIYNTNVHAVIMPTVPCSTTILKQQEQGGPRQVVGARGGDAHPPRGGNQHAGCIAEGHRGCQGLFRQRV